jgi:hypothetical protein
VDVKGRAIRGALGGLGATLVLSGLREAWAKMGLVFETAPMQVVERVEKLSFVGELSPAARSLLTVVAHFAYGVGTGAVLVKSQPWVRRLGSSPGGLDGRAGFR